MLTPTERTALDNRLAKAEAHLNRRIERWVRSDGITITEHRHILNLAAYVAMGYGMRRDDLVDAKVADAKHYQN